ncbi:MAG: hypothetical protein EBZ60_04380 [Betaproteobacteria bacterium]|nr:hypothetical protein [Betaproteobacteria bacterium]
MNSFFQLFLAWGLLLVFVLMLYVVDKVNVIYQGYAEPDLPKTFSDGLFGELSGKTLWDAMSGIPVPGVDAKLASSLKPHYEPVLRQHIEQVFMEGLSHGKAGTAGVPTNNRIITTPRGSVESWLPIHHLASIYQAGVDFAANNPEDLLRIQQSLDQVTAMIYARIGVEMSEAYSATLLVQLEEDESGQMLPPPESELMINPPAQLTEATAQPVLQPDLNTLKPFALEPVQATEHAEAVTTREEAKPIPA